MSEERINHIHLELARGYEFVASFPDFPAAAPVLLDEPPPLGESKGPNAAAMLGAAVGNCLGASLLFCLRKARVVPEGLKVDVRTRIVRNDAGRFRIEGIEVSLVPEVSRGDSNRLQRCGELFEDFCIVTESVRAGIPVTVTLADTEQGDHQRAQGTPGR